MEKEYITNKYVMRNSRLEDYEELLSIYERARTFMRETGNPRQWNTSWPPATLIKEDIELGNNRVLERVEDEKFCQFLHIFKVWILIQHIEG